MIYFWLIFSVILEILGDYFFKINREFLGIVFYLLGVAPWFLVLKNCNLSTSIVVFTALNVLGCIFVGQFFLHEELTVAQFVGIVFCLLGILLIQ
jgi:multidrug transporter EmrE-like cation transporter